MTNKANNILRLGLATVIVAASGCAEMQVHRSQGPSSPQVAAADMPPPMVQDCGIVGISSPSKFACNGKTYTSFDLLKLRLAWEKEHGS